MLVNWNTVFVVQVLIWLIVLFEWKRLKNAPKADKITFVTILILSALLSFFHLDNLPGPMTFLDYIFGPLSKIME